MCLRSYEATGSLDDLRLSSQIVDKCSSSLGSSKHSRNVTFLCGNTGVYALGAVVAHYQDDQQRRKKFLDMFIEVAQESSLSAGAEEGGFGMSYELLHGRAGFLFSALFINRYLGPDTVPYQLLKPIIKAVLTGGRAGSGHNSDCPLMYRWHGTRFLGAASGLAGILHILLHFPLEVEEREDVEAAIWYLVRNRFKHGGNYPSSQNNSRDALVQWSHGAGGVAIMLCKAAQVYAEEKKTDDFHEKALKFHDAAIEAVEVVWRRGQSHKIGLADGMAGNTYTFISLYRLTADQLYLNRAEVFAAILHEKIKKMMPLDDTSDEELNVFSLFHGLAGVACLFFDIASPVNSMFPGFEV
ncbi:LanC-like protein 2 [Rhynchospora pubera]|uniref:LanC-like protein 2 n=1 Tax=Rhynchospora pubera TaxID=906938 RepID=A0AAV8CTU0_9POAL|nr:LanC-like protein 2 [Rhynchospora pubera]